MYGTYAVSPSATSWSGFWEGIAKPFVPGTPVALSAFTTSVCERTQTPCAVARGEESEVHGRRDRVRIHEAQGRDVLVAAPRRLRGRHHPLRGGRRVRAEGHGRQEGGGEGETGDQAHVEWSLRG